MSRTVATEPPMGLRLRLALLVPLAGGLTLSLLDPLSAMFFGSYAVAGWLLVVRRPRNVIGWLLLVIAFGFVGTTTRPGVDSDALVAGTASTADFAWAWLGSWAGTATFTAYLALTILFPTGRFPSGRARWLGIVLLAIPAAAAVLTATGPTISYNPNGLTQSLHIANRLALFPDLPLWQVATADVLIFVVIAALAVGVAWMFVRFRRATGLLRLQMRWLVASVTAIVCAVLTGLTLLAVFGDDAWFAWLPAVFAYPTLPIAIGIAILRYRLYEIDRIISRTIGWLVVTGTVVAVFAGAVVGLQGLLSPFTGDETLAIAASTLLVAALFQPLRRRIQRSVDRRFNRSRTDAERAASAFTGRIRDQVDLTHVHASVLLATIDAVRPAAAGLWLRPRPAAGRSADPR